MSRPETEPNRTEPSLSVERKHPARLLPRLAVS